MRTIGPSRANSWQVDAGHADLVRPVIEPRRLSFAAVPQRVTIDLNRTAIIVVDMQNDFCEPDGWFALKGVDIAPTRGSWGAAVIDTLPGAPGDIMIDKQRLSGFWDNELDSVLRNLGITTLLFAGINIDRCVFATLQDASFLGYDCILLEDASATVSPQYVTDAILFLVRQLYGFTAQAEAMLVALGA